MPCQKQKQRRETAPGQSGLVFKTLIFIATTIVGYDEGSGAGGGGDVPTPSSEYRRPLYRHLANTGAMSGGGETAGGDIMGDGILTSE